MGERGVFICISRKYRKIGVVKMNKLLRELCGRLNEELGLVAHLISIGGKEKITGGLAYDDRNGIPIYIKKYEIYLKEETFHIKLPLGQKFIESNSKTDEEVINILANHFFKGGFNINQ